MMNGFNRPRMPMQNPGAGQMGGNTPNGNAYGYWRNQQGQNPGFGAMGQQRRAQPMPSYRPPQPPPMTGIAPQQPAPPQLGGPLPPYNPQQDGTTTIGNGYSNATVPTPNFNQSSTPLPSAPPPNVQAFLDYLRQRYASALSGQQYG